AVQDGLAETDARGMIRVGNTQLARLLTVPASFLRGKALISFVARGDCGAFRVMMDAVRSGGECDAVFVRLRPRRGGLPFMAEVRVRATSGTGVRGFVWTVRALTHSIARGANDANPGSVAALLHGAAIAI